MLSEFKTYSAAFDDQIDRYLTQFEYSRYGNGKEKKKGKRKRRKEGEKEGKKKRDKERE